MNEEKVNYRYQLSFVEKKHMIPFFPDGSVQTKINICSCEEHLKGEFVKC